MNEQTCLYVWLLRDDTSYQGMFYRRRVIMVHGTDAIVLRWAGRPGVQWEPFNEMESALAFAASATDLAAEDGLTLWTPFPVRLDHDTTICQQLADREADGAHAVDQLLRRRLEREAELTSTM